MFASLPFDVEKVAQKKDAEAAKKHAEAAKKKACAQLKAWALELLPAGLKLRVTVDEVPCASGGGGALRGSPPAGRPGFSDLQGLPRGGRGVARRRPRTLASMSGELRSTASSS